MDSYDLSPATGRAERGFPGNEPQPHCVSFRCPQPLARPCGMTAVRWGHGAFTAAMADNAQSADTTGGASVEGKGGAGGEPALLALPHRQHSRNYY